MAWEIKDTGQLIVAPTELQAWIMYFGLQGKCFDAALFLYCIGLTGLKAIEVR